MRKYILILLPLLVAAQAVFAQSDVQYSVNNLMRYGNGKQIQTDGLGDVFEYFETQTNVRLYVNDFTVGFQYQYDDPPEFGPRIQAVDERFVEFRRAGVELRLGHGYSLYGKGLAMNLFEDRAINYDTKLDGFKGVYRDDLIQAEATAGTVVYYDLIDYDRREEYSVRSAHLQLRPYKWLRFGGSLVGVNGELPSPIVTPDGPSFDQVDAEIPHAMLSLSGFGLDVFASYAKKTSRVVRPLGGNTFNSFESSGEGIYGSVVYTKGSLGVTFEYKDYKFDLVNPDLQVERNRPTKALPIQVPPQVFKEHSFFLLSRDPHVINFNDEIGMQLDVYYALSPELTLNLNGAVASRHYAYEGQFRDWTRIEPESSIMPSMDGEFSPFYELYADAEWYFDGQSYIKVAFNRRYDEQWEDRHIKHSTSLPILIEYILDDVYSLGVALEQQFYHDSVKKDKPDYYNQYVSVTLGKSPDWTATVRLEYTTDESLFRAGVTDPNAEFPAFQSGKNFWRTVEFSYRLGYAHTATVSYGNERGGIVCSNGICRNVLPFDGLRLMLLTQL
ncbi:MAG: hypothetical protein CL946_05765 [Ectothiorhodospiraceae bacterium]|nr:hypothetical protein [Ectothiorhodospiraceae bacterium]